MSFFKFYLNTVYTNCKANNVPYYIVHAIYLLAAGKHVSGPTSFMINQLINSLVTMMIMTLRQ
jgi:hypothetical protein